MSEQSWTVLASSPVEAGKPQRHIAMRVVEDRRRPVYAVLEQSGDDVILAGPVLDWAAGVKMARMVVEGNPRAVGHPQALLALASVILGFQAEVEGAAQAPEGDPV